MIPPRIPKRIALMESFFGAIPCCHVNRPLSFWIGDGNGQIGFSGCAVNVRVSGDKKSFSDRRTHGLNHRRMRLCSGQSIFVNLGRFYCAEYDQDHRTNKNDEQHRHTEAAKGNEPFPVSLPPVGFWRRRNWWRCLLHGVFVRRTQSSWQPISSLQSALDGSRCREAGWPP